MSFYNVTSSEYAHFYHNYIMGTDKQPDDTLQSITTNMAVIDRTPQADCDPDEDFDWIADDIGMPVPVKGPAFKERSQSDFLDLTPPDNIPYKYENEARLYGQFCSTVLYRLEQCASRVEEWKRITEDYNRKELISELYGLLGRRNERCLRLWLERYLENNRDMFSLVHKNKNQLRGRKVTYIEQNYLLNLLLNPNNIKVGSAISSLKDADRMEVLESPSSIPTLKRWCIDWELNNKAIWTQARSGSKAVAESIVKTIIRDASLLNVGDVWVADGHNLAFDIMNPKTGKAQRMTMIMVFDWASRYPVGASLAFTEDSHHIQVAFRNGFLNWGALPKRIYLDNGKAFKSKLFHEKWEEHDLELELGGIFPRLGINVVFAKSYNAKAKPIERFFKTFQEQFERFISSFRGSCIDDKPAPLMRNEKWARKLFEAHPPTIEETMQMIAFYIRHIYGENHHSGLGGKTPWQVFSSSKLPADRLVVPGKLNNLMLSVERKRIRNNGIIIDKLLYWDVELVNHIGKDVVIRYDLGDARWILVFDKNDKYLCQAELRRTQHPMIQLAEDQPTSFKELNKEYTEIKKLQRNTERKTKTLVRQTQIAVDRLMVPMRKAIAPDTNPIFKQPAMIEPPKQSRDQAINTMEKQMVKSLPKLEPIKPDIPVHHPDTIESLPLPQLAEEQDTVNKPKPKSFEEMLKRAGIR
ncbi:MAG: Mu transposase C-terminal domain-containing protein [Candidatus Cloacimonadaceae bacterium]|nr:Mu transposase C-terminal domain-containing protein [Candidatus Cloacimonadaceae bacterium]